MKLLIGLGNPGIKYARNRHNVGHMFVDYLHKTCNMKHVTSHPEHEFKYQKDLLSDVLMLHATCYMLHENVLLVKPKTYMNESGIAVQKCVTCYMLHVTSDLIVVHDDLDIPLGKFRIVRGYGPKLHNGIESIENKLQTKDFLRVRIGVDNRLPENRMAGIEYVLEDFTREELELIQKTFPQIENLLKTEKLL